MQGVTVLDRHRVLRIGMVLVGCLFASMSVFANDRELPPCAPNVDSSLFKNLSDAAQIRQTVSVYYRAWDCGEVEDAIAILAEDFVFRVNGGYDLQEDGSLKPATIVLNKAEVGKLLKLNLEQVKKHKGIHPTSDYIIGIDGNSATLTARVALLRAFPEDTLEAGPMGETVLVSTSSLWSTLRKTGGRWLIVQLTLYSDLGHVYEQPLVSMFDQAQGDG